MDKDNFFGLLCIISFVSFAACGKSQSQMTAQHYTVGGISKLDEYMKACSEALNKFNTHLSIEPKNVTFKSFYYKMLKWLLHHTSRIRNSVIVVTTSDLDNAITGILAEIETLDIRTAFDEKIYHLQDPSQLSLFGEEIDNALQLIHDIESREVEVNKIFLKKSKDPSQVKLLYGRTKYYEIVCRHDIACSKVDVNESFFRKLSNSEDYIGKAAEFRNLKLIGLVDAALMISAEGSTPHKENVNYEYEEREDEGGVLKRQPILRDFMYENVSLKTYFPGSMSHFKFSSLIFFKAVEQCVFQELVPELVNDVTYQFQITLLENYSTRSLDLRFRALNDQVADTLNIVGKSYSTHKNRLSDPTIRTRFYRLLKWLEKQTQYRARHFTESGIEFILLNNEEIASIANDAASASIPDGICTLKQLVEFCNDGKTPQVSYLSLHYWINSFGSLLSKLW